ncbi:hypothetical protein Xaut_0537 [Xanthobacter versatilis]|uniref:Uncharacterized protein n=1 Tax=Xanthobacter autotrophicus (strain ATCC BAA-1158 / Py2) TaxID=78245 RepID=A7ICQ0_XANP2|nr:hypothetical protein Xaut_0537 [Xanthobacter autotrophicus Py2]
MRYTQVFYCHFAILCFLALAGPARADTVAAAATAQPAGAPQDRTAIVEDDVAGAFRFIIDGREVARLDTEGLHVRKSVTYGGTINDVGEAFYEKTLVDKPARAHAEGAR